MSEIEVSQIVQGLLDDGTLKTFIFCTGIIFACVGGVFWGLISLFWDFVDMIIKKERKKNHDC